MSCAPYLDRLKSCAGSIPAASTTHSRAARRKRLRLKCRKNRPGTFFRRLRAGIECQVVLDAAMDCAGLRARLACDPVSPVPLALFEDRQWREHTYEQPLEAGKLGAPPVEPTTINEDVIDEHVVAAAGTRCNRCSHPCGGLLADTTGHDRRVVPPEESLRGARTVFHPPLIDRAP